MTPVCKGCTHYAVTGIEIKENKWRYQHRCLHPQAQHKECGYGKLGVTKGFEVKRKTCPRWCPLKLKRQTEWGENYGKRNIKKCPPTGRHDTTTSCRFTC